MRKTRLVFPVVLFAGCVGANPLFGAAPQSLTIGDFVKVPYQHDGKRIVVVGMIQFDASQYAYLYSDADHAARDDAAAGVDLGIPASVNFDDSLLSGSHCVEVSGNFIAYSDKMIVTGNPRSRAGGIKAEYIKKLKSSQCG